MKFIREILPYIIIVIVVLTIRTYIATPVIVSGESMSPTLEDNQILLLNEMDKDYERFDIIVIDFDNGKLKEKLIKRIIGLPGEIIKYSGGKLYINGHIYDDPYSSFTDDFIESKKIPDDEYLVLGDNRLNSVDSRMLGFISKKDIKGKTEYRLFPFKKFGKIE